MNHAIIYGVCSALAAWATFKFQPPGSSGQSKPKGTVLLSTDQAWLQTVVDVACKCQACTMVAGNSSRTGKCPPEPSDVTDAIRQNRPLQRPPFEGPPNPIRRPSDARTDAIRRNRPLHRPLSEAPPNPIPHPSDGLFFKKCFRLKSFFLLRTSSRCIMAVNLHSAYIHTDMQQCCTGHMHIMRWRAQAPMPADYGCAHKVS